MQQCDMCHPPPASQLPLPSSYNGTKCHGIVQTVSMSTHNTPPSHNPTHHGAQSVVGLAAGRAGQRSQSCSSAPRPGPPRPQHGTRHGLSFSLSAPARPRRRAGPALRTRTTPHISCSLLAGQHAVTGGPQHHHHRPLLGAAAAGGVAGAGRGPAGGSPAQPPPGTAARGRAGRGRHWPHTTTAQQQRRGKILAKTQSAQLLHT